MDRMGAGDYYLVMEDGSLNPEVVAAVQELMPVIAIRALYRIGRRGDEFDELVQNSALAVAAGWHSFRAEASRVSWVRGIVDNQAKLLFSTNAKHRRIRHAATTQKTLTVRSAEEASLESMTTRAIGNEVSTWSEEDARILEMWIGGYSYSAICSESGLTLGQLKYRLRKLKGTIEGALRDEGHLEGGASA